MVNNITIGQFYPVKSKIHKLDPRIKITGVMLYIIFLFIANNAVGYLLSFCFLAFVVKKSNVPIKMILKSLKGVVIIITFTIIVNLFFNKIGTPIFEFEIITITKEGVFSAVGMAFRLILIILSSSVLTLTTSPIELTDGIEYLLSPLKRINFPAHDVAMMMTIALRFIPTLIEEMDKIMKAQMARGASFDTGNLIERGKSLVPVLVPLFISSFRRADELAMAMEARCYRGDIERTRMKELKICKNDKVAIIILLVFCILLVFVGRFLR